MFGAMRKSVIMQLTFYLQCFTRFGENLFVEISGGSYAMEYVAHGTWRCVCHVPSEALFHYRYFIDDDSGLLSYEWGGTERQLPSLAHLERFCCYDQFERLPQQAPFHTIPFDRLFCKHTPLPSSPTLSSTDCLIRAQVPGVLPEQGVGVLGEHGRLGGWQAAEVVPMHYVGNSTWELLIEQATLLQGSEYKCVLYNVHSSEVVSWEEGDNRHMPYLEGATLLTLTPQFPKDWRGAGVAIPLFSLRSEASWGIGDFMDLQQMVDWTEATGQRVIQLLPINDTTQCFDQRDSYPYRAISIYALHPLYLSLPAMASEASQAIVAGYLPEGKQLNALATVDYPAVLSLKWRCFRELYACDGATLLASSAFAAFWEQHHAWLLPYGVFCVLRDNYGTATFGSWGELTTFDGPAVEAYAQAHAAEVGFYYYLQYHAEQQLQAMCDYAHAHGVILKGDLPIGISGDSVEAWQQPELFHMDRQTGAPPDPFSEVGQNWGFPTYNWEAMSANHYAWWKSRFERMERFFDAFRIDHILGFFRIWEIPQTDVLGLCGHFSPALPLSCEELAQQGIVGDLSRFTTPYITAELLQARFPERHALLQATFLEPQGSGLLQFKSGYQTQREVAQFYHAQGWMPERATELLQLQLLQCEVLLLEDPDAPGHYHPRIRLQESGSFEALPIFLKHAFSALHDDFFYRRHDEFWRREAMVKLPELMSTTQMLICGEDLGMLPNCVAPVMSQLEILSLEIQRMPKAFGALFVEPEATPYFSVLSSGSHDMSTLRGWWQENRTLTQQFYETMLAGHGEAPVECRAVVVEQILTQLLHGNSMWTIIPWQDYMGMDARLRRADVAAERINDPANPNNYWCYRMHLTLEQLLQEQLFNERLRYLVRASGR